VSRCRHDFFNADTAFRPKPSAQCPSPLPHHPWRAPLADVQDAQMPRRPGMAESGLDPIGEANAPSAMCRMHECRGETGTSAAAKSANAPSVARGPCLDPIGNGRAASRSEPSILGRSCRRLRMAASYRDEGFRRCQPGDSKSKALERQPGTSRRKPFASDGSRRFASESGG
jgi:hypothetical protein